MLIVIYMSRPHLWLIFESIHIFLFEEFLYIVFYVDSLGIYFPDSPLSG